MVTHQLPRGDGLLAGAANCAPGSLVAGYLLEEQIGAGGMAVVFRARDIRLGRPVALKILAPALAVDKTFRQRFIRESRAAAAVDDPHIIPVFEAGEAAGALFIAMRYVPGGDVRTLVRREGPLEPVRVTAIISAVASALDAAHAAGLVHRDVKPANMLLDIRPGWPDHVYLSDFGLSNEAMSMAGLTAPGQFFGTPDYAAPEQIQGQPVSGKADQYALACAAFEMFCGQAPFQRDQGMAVMWAHVSQPPPALTSRRPDLLAAADDVLARALAKEPVDRYGSCREFADSLREALGLAAGQARSAYVAAPTAAAPAGRSFLADPTERPDETGRGDSHPEDCTYPELDELDLAERPSGTGSPAPIDAVPAPRREPPPPSARRPAQTSPGARPHPRRARPRHGRAQAGADTGRQGTTVSVPRRRRVATSAVVVVAVVAAVAAGVAGVATFTDQTTNGIPDPPTKAAAAIRAHAAAWIEAQVARSAIVACDPLMCRALEADGWPAGQIVVITTATPDPLGSDIIAATAAVRSQIGSRLVSVYAPSVIASFGAGRSRIDIRVTAANGAAAYRSALRSDLHARRVAGADLLRSRRIWVSPAARRQLAAGAVDTRLLITLGYFGSTRPIRIIAFADAGPGASAGMPLRAVYLQPGGKDTTARARSGAVAAMLVFFHVQRPPLAATVIREPGPAGQTTLQVEFTAPSPLGLLGTTSAATVRLRPRALTS